MLNDFLIHPERLVTIKHAYNNPGYTGCSWTRFVPIVEYWLRNFPENSDKFNCYGTANENTAGVYLTRTDGQPFGTNGELVAEFRSGFVQGTHGWPWSAQNELPNNAVQYFRINDHFE